MSLDASICLRRDIPDYLGWGLFRASFYMNNELLGTPDPLISYHTLALNRKNVGEYLPSITAAKLDHELLNMEDKWLFMDDEGIDKLQRWIARSLCLPWWVNSNEWSLPCTTYRGLWFLRPERCLREILVLDTIEEEVSSFSSPFFELSAPFAHRRLFECSCVTSIRIAAEEADSLSPGKKISAIHYSPVSPSSDKLSKSKQRERNKHQRELC